MTNYALMDDVNGEIVGGGKVVGWLTYEGRHQGQIFYRDTEQEIREACQDEYQRMLEEYGQAFDMIFPDSTAWRVNFG